MQKEEVGDVFMGYHPDAAPAIVLKVWDMLGLDSNSPPPEQVNTTLVQWDSELFLLRLFTFCRLFWPCFVWSYLLSQFCPIIFKWVSVWTFFLSFVLFCSSIFKLILSIHIHVSQCELRPFWLCFVQSYSHCELRLLFPYSVQSHVSQCEVRLFLPCFVQSHSCESVWISWPGVSRVPTPVAVVRHTWCGGALTWAWVERGVPSGAAARTPAAVPAATTAATCRAVHHGHGTGILSAPGSRCSSSV